LIGTQREREPELRKNRILKQAQELSIAAKETLMEIMQSFWTRGRRRHLPPGLGFTNKKGFIVVHPHSNQLCRYNKSSEIPVFTVSIPVEGFDMLWLPTGCDCQ
jgi:hypothetical protein